MNTKHLQTHMDNINERAYFSVKNTMKSVYWLYIVFFLSLFQTSQARTYEIELIVFSNDASNTNEQWDFASETTTTQLHQHNKSSAKARDIENPRTFTTLAGIKNQLAGSGQHRILKTLSWTQSSASYANSPLIRVESPSHQLDGTIRVYAPNLLFAEFNLRLYPSLLAQPQFALAEVEQYFLQEKRRLKLKEIHYFDHPLFSAILSVRPIAVE